jgi:hypothetical protein
MPQPPLGRAPIIAAINAEEARMLYTAFALSLFGAAYAFLLSLTLF